MHARPDQWQTATEFVKRHLNPRQFEIESRLLAIAHGAGCAPSFTIAPPLTIRLKLHQPLTDWLVRASPSGKHTMAACLFETIRGLHAVGICHRDIKVTDVVLDAGQPLLIDFELGTEIDPHGRCYDLLGPRGSGIPIPLVHRVFALLDGVWWESAAGGLGQEFGRLPGSGE